MVTQSEVIFDWNALVSNVVGKDDTSPTAENKSEGLSSTKGEGREESNVTSSVAEERDGVDRDTNQGSAVINRTGSTMTTDAVKPYFMGAQAAMTEIMNERDRKTREGGNEQDSDRGKCGDFTMCNPEVYGTKEERSKPVMERQDDALDYVFNLVEIAICGDKKSNIDESVAKTKAKEMPDLDMLRGKNIFQTLNPGKSRSSKSKRRSDKENSSKKNGDLPFDEVMSKDEKKENSLETKGRKKESERTTNEEHEKKKQSTTEAQDSSATLPITNSESQEKKGWGFGFAFGWPSQESEDIAQSEADLMKDLNQQRNLAEAEAGVNEINDLSQRQERGEEIDEDRLYELELFERYRQGSDLNEDEKEDLEFFKQQRSSTKDQGTSASKVKSEVNKPLPTMKKVSKVSSEPNEALPRVIHLNFEKETIPVPANTYSPSIRKLLNGKSSAKKSSTTRHDNRKSSHYSTVLAKPDNMRPEMQFLTSLISAAGNDSPQFQGETPGVRGVHMLGNVVSFLFWPEDLPRNKVEKPAHDGPKPSLLSLVGGRKSKKKSSSSAKRIVGRPRPRLPRRVKATR